MLLIDENKSTYAWEPHKNAGTFSQLIADKQITLNNKTI